VRVPFREPNFWNFILFDEQIAYRLGGDLNSYKNDTKSQGKKAAAT
jgi:hypothetical protein